MKVTYLWEGAESTLSPSCKTETVNSDGFSLLSCLLMDDGGIPYSQTIPWIEEGVMKVDSVLSGKAVSSSWARESWGVLITLDVAKIYSIHDETYFEELTLQQFRNALVSWEAFLEAKPNTSEQKTIEL
ncbi:hypothetical protein F9L16_15095 [Agarivorans sp. B2Z047]|uniref:hypothetical protein n=1 Tax=Agarivorans sp. B2Z047 TaxID=2652721 RepID=UPI00128CEB35|nr:hypothetical protein [Agarivorans sp. B2Z047]MPW30312.1 hypothetical protein [Agarivorans sp. B2Z047]UQN43058.1 hypothetical protein LQZ07_00870 [Agarivorans sp. B2Z047]